MGLARTLVLFFFFLTLALVHLTLSTKRINLEYQIQQFSTEQATWKERNEWLQYEAARLEALPRVDLFARERAGMKRPEKFSYFFVPQEP